VRNDDIYSFRWGDPDYCPYKISHLWDSRHTPVRSVHWKWIVAVDWMVSALSLPVFAQVMTEDAPRCGRPDRAGTCG
jgi:hypothetical protein